MRVLELIERIHRENYPGRPFTSRAVREAFLEEGFREDRDFPEWFVRMLEMVADHVTGKFRFFRPELTGPGGGWDIAVERAFADASKMLGWEYEFDGGYQTVVFPRLRLLLTICEHGGWDEAGRRLAFVAIDPIKAGDRLHEPEG